MGRLNWFAYAGALLLLLIGCFVIGLASGLSASENVTKEHCDTLGKFRVKETVYICHKEK